MSPTNLRIFSAAQVDNATRRFSTGPEPRHLPPLHVERSKFRESAAEFLGSGRSSFVLVGECGIGKTSELIEFSGRLRESGQIVFYIDMHLGLDPLDILAEEVGATFPDARSRLDVLRDLSETAAVTGTNVVLLIDSLDDRPDDARRVLSRLSSRLEAFGGRIKMFIACNPYSWSVLRTANRTPSNLAVVGRELGETPDHSLGTLESTELDDAFAKGRESFQIGGELSGAARSLAAHPGLLRILLSSFTGRSIPGVIRGRELLDSYSAWRGRGSNGPSIALALRGAAIAFVNAGERSPDPVFSIPELDLASQVPLESLSAAVECGLLSRSEEHVPKISFSPWLLQHLSIADYILGNPRLPLTADLIAQWIENPTVRRALGWHCTSLVPTDAAKFTAPLEAGARTYIRAFRQVLTKLPVLAGGLENGAASLVLVATYDRLDPWYGVRSGGAPVEWAEIDIDRSDRAALAVVQHRHKLLRGLRHRSGTFLSAEVAARAAEDACAWLREDLQRSRLNFLERNAIALETAWALLEAFSQSLGRPLTTDFASWDDLERLVATEQARRFFEERESRRDALGKAIDSVARGERPRPNRRMFGHCLPVEAAEQVLAALPRDSILRMPSYLLSTQIALRPKDDEEREILREAIRSLFSTARVELKSIARTSFEGLSELIESTERALEIAIFPRQMPAARCRSTFVLSVRLERRSTS